MPATAAIGTLLKMGDGATPENFTTIARVVDGSGPGLKGDTQDVTNHSSTGSYEEHVVTVLRTGEIKLKLQFGPTEATHSQSTGLIYNWKNKTKSNYQLVFTVGTTWTIPAFVTGFEPKWNTTGALEADVTLKPSGSPTLAG